MTSPPPILILLAPVLKALALKATVVATSYPHAIPVIGGLGVGVGVVALGVNYFSGEENEKDD